MAIGGPILLIIAGAILRFAINVQAWWWAAHGWWISVPTLGDILLIGGVVWLGLALGLEASKRAQARRREAEQREREDRRDAEQREREERRLQQQRQYEEDDWRRARELEHARSTARMAQRAAAGGRRRDDDQDDA